MALLKMPVVITITVTQGDGSVMRTDYLPGKNLTDDGVRVSSDLDRREFRDGTTATYTKHVIEWTEVEYDAHSGLPGDKEQ